MLTYDDKPDRLRRIVCDVLNAMSLEGQPTPTAFRVENAVPQHNWMLVTVSYGLDGFPMCSRLELVISVNRGDMVRAAEIVRSELTEKLKQARELLRCKPDFTSFVDVAWQPAPEVVGMKSIEVQLGGNLDTLGGLSSFTDPDAQYLALRADAAEREGRSDHAERLRGIAERIDDLTALGQRQKRLQAEAAACRQCGKPRASHEYYGLNYYCYPGKFTLFS